MGDASSADIRSIVPVIERGTIDAVVFDMDGVITDTARVHAAAWKQLFDDFLRHHATRTGAPFDEFTDADYLAFVDGKPRYDGVRSFLASRGVELPEGTDRDEPGDETVQALGNQKNAFFLAELREYGADPYPHAVELVHRLQDAGIGTAIISASRNASAVLEAAGLGDLFHVCIDGVVAAERSLPGKPDPAVFIEAARELGAGPTRTAIVEDAQAGVEAGRAGGFALVIGVDRGGNEQALREHGADVVVTDLGSTLAGDGTSAPTGPMASRPDALASWPRIRDAIGGRSPTVFLDYDGTLTPIVERPEDAHLGDPMREVLSRLSSACTVAVVSGRDVSFVVDEVGLDNVIYLGSHGFDIVTPAGIELSTGREDEFAAFLEPLDRVQAAIESALSGIAGAQVERKKYAVAVHYRQAALTDVPAVQRTVDEQLEAHPELRRSGGKKVFELRPDIDWDKGRAVRWTLDALGTRTEGTLPVYVGDDLTDEDAFAELAGDGLTVVVGGDGRETAALFRVADVGAVHELLDLLARTTEGS